MVVEVSSKAIAKALDEMLKVAKVSEVTVELRG